MSFSAPEFGVQGSLFAVLKSKLQIIISALVLLCLSSTIASAADELEGSDFGINGDGAGLSFVLAPGNRPSLAYFNRNSSELRYSNYFAGVWSTSIVDSHPSNIQSDTALVFYNNLPSIFYFDSAGKLIRSWYTGSSWKTSAVDSSSGNGGTISATVCGNSLCISYYNRSSRTLKMAEGNGTSWKTETVDPISGVGESSSIALQQNGLPIIVYYDGNKRKPKLAYKQASGTWVFETISMTGHSFGAFPDIYVAPDGSMYFTSSRPRGDAKYDLALYYAVKPAGSGWNVVLVNNDFVGERSSVLVGESGEIQIAHRYKRVSESFGNHSAIELSSLQSSGQWHAKQFSGSSVAAASLYQFEYIQMERTPFGKPAIAAQFQISSIAGQPATKAIRFFLAKDTDGDGIPDKEETVLGTNWKIADTDGDGFDDGTEQLIYQTDPRRHDSRLPTNDFDKDGVIDAFDIDDDNDGISDLDEAVNGTHSKKADTDSDGVLDGQELVDGSNPLDPGSFLSTLGTTLCGEWNGFLDGMWNILEQVNLSNRSLRAETTLYDISGNPVSSTACQIAPGSQCDLLVHDMAGRVPNSYGKICVKHDGEPGDLDGRMVYYKHDKYAGQYQFAFAMAFSNGLAGRQFVSYNTFQPSMNPGDISNLVANWIQLTNLSDKPEAGNLVFYNQAGGVIRQNKIVLAAGARQDFAGHEVGPSLYGMIAWIPESKTALFQLRNVRYLYDNPWGQNSFDTAFQLPGAIGTEERQLIPLSTESSSAIIELMNTSDTNSGVNVKLYSEYGEERASYDFILAPRSSFHLVTDLDLGLGKRGVASVSGKSILAVAMQYKRDESGSVKAMYGIKAKETLGMVLRGSYNTFLGQESELVITNGSSESTQAYVSMIRSDGSAAVLGYPFDVPGRGQVSVLLNQFDAADNYGVVTVHSSAGSVFSAWVNRNKENNYTIPTLLRQ